MNPRTTPARSAALYPVAANEGQTPITGFPGDLQDVCNLGIGEAIELQRAWLASIASLNSCAMGAHQNAFCFPPFLAPFFDTMTKSIASCLELQMNWLNLLLSRAGSTVVSVPGSQAQTEEEASERSMDFAVETFENY
jgi:hypothetical protein